MPAIHGRLWDQQSGAPLAGRVAIIDSSGAFRRPEGAILKVGEGERFFYAEETFAVDLPQGGPTLVVAERGTEYRRLEVPVDLGPSGSVEVDLPLERWTSMAESGWHAGNTHVHYDEHERRPIERLRLDPRVEDLPVLIVSVLERWGLPYASNAFPIGRHALSTGEHIIDIGEENRHDRRGGGWGLGHMMLIRLTSRVEPVSRGWLEDAARADYPPLLDACDRARSQGGLVIWCHNGQGMEAPVAAMLGRVDGINLFDPYWLDPEYSIWYRLLNCGLRLPASTGSDWFICSSNRVYVETGTAFSYERWLAGLGRGQTMITNGPILWLTVEGRGPENDSLELGPRRRTVAVRVSWSSALPVDRIDIVVDGRVAESHEVSGGRVSGTWAPRLDVGDAGWLTARAAGRARTSYGHAVWAHTGPVYLRSRPSRAAERSAAASFVREIDTAIGWLGTEARIDEGADRIRVRSLFEEARGRFEALAR